MTWGWVKRELIDSRAVTKAEEQYSDHIPNRFPRIARTQDLSFPGHRPQFDNYQLGQGVREMGPAHASGKLTCPRETKLMAGPILRSLIV